MHTVSSVIAAGRSFFSSEQTQGNIGYFKEVVAYFSMADQAALTRDFAVFEATGKVSGLIRSLETRVNVLIQADNMLDRLDERCLIGRRELETRTLAAA